MRKALLVFTILLCTFISFSQTVDITGNPSTSSTSAFATNPYAANESIYTEAEIGAGNFLTAVNAINKIGFNIAQLGTNNSFGLIKIYLKEVPAGTTIFASGTYSTTGYTQVFGGATGGTVILSTTGFTEITLSTTFVRTTGNNLQVLIERADNTGHSNFIYRTANGNNTGATVFSGRRYNSTSALSSSPLPSLTAGAFRAQIRFKHEFANDAAVLPIYSLGKLPINNAVPHIISTTVLNNGAQTITALQVTLTITGANSFADVQTIATLAPGASAIVNFTAFTPTVTGTNNISVTVPPDDDNTNNISTTLQIVNTNTWSYSQGNTSTGTAGANNTIDLVSKYYNSTATLLSQAAVYFSANGQPYKIGVWDASGTGGSPGSLLFETTLQTSVAGLNMVPIIPALPVNVGNFYIGVRQTTTTNFNLLRQTESPLRSNNFYYASPTGTAWVDNSTGSSNRFMIDPKLQTPIDAFVTKIILPNNGGTTCSINSETINAEITNVGSSTIAANAATVTLKITGANPQILQTTNLAAINSGGKGLVNFTGVNLSNPGINYDTVYVNLPGDAEALNDTANAVQTVTARNVALETTVNTYVLTSNCDDLGWTYYKDALQNNVLAVQWGSNTASKAVATASLTLDAALFSATAGSAAAAKGTFTMKRYWNVDVGTTEPGTPVNVRFFYDAVEKNATDVAANNYQSANTGSSLKAPNWFKTSSGAFTADATHVTADGVANTIALTDVNTTAATVNNILYAQFNGVTSFSGGTYAAGVGTGSVLPVNIVFFKGSKQGAENILTWKITCVGSPSVKIITERSRDGILFEMIAEQTATDTRCLQAFSYTDTKPLTGANYYRLKTITPDGKLTYSNIVVLLNKANGFELISIAPNPIKNNVVINITTVKAGQFVFSLTDIAGKIVFKKLLEIAGGNSLITMNFSTIHAGIYALKIIAADGEVKTIKFVKY